MAWREFFRHTVQKGAWTRLLSIAAAYLRQQDLLEPESKLPDDEVFATRPVAVVAATVPAHSCAWRKEYRSHVRINVAELEAFLREEARLAGRSVSKRALFGLDSQVSLGALIKGRSASPALNDLLSASLGPVLSSRIFSHVFFFPSSLNPADDPTRAQAAPTVPPPPWWDELAPGTTRLLGSIVGWRCVNRTSPANSSRSSSLSLVALSLLCSPRTGSDPDPLNLLCHPVHLPSAFPCLAALQALGLLRLSCANRAVGLLSLTLADATFCRRRCVISLAAFPRSQFVCAGASPDLSRPGALDLFSGKAGVARALVRRGANRC